MTLCPGHVTLAELEILYRSPIAAEIDSSFDAGIDRAAAAVQDVARGEMAVYGVNTGFGKLAAVRIAPADLVALQRNLILSHCCGMGEPLSADVVRLVLALKLISLGRGASGVRREVVRLIEGLLRAGITPHIPAKGSVGASGDLAPLAHMAATLIGEGDAFQEGLRLPARLALERAGLRPVVLAAKEGLALINGTQVSTALALAGLFKAHRAMQAALITGAASTDAAMGSSAPFHSEIHALRGHGGQIDTAAALRALLDGSGIRESHRCDDARVQDPYCLRCQPQVNGACLDVLRQAARTLTIEANAVTDNPLVLEDGTMTSGGNFHAEPVALAADQIALAVCEIGSIAQRRIALLVDPALSHGLPAFLTPRPGLHSGLMIAEVTSAALMSENRQMAHPASVDSTPTSANQEDHVSMACHGARRLLAMTDNLAGIIGIEALTSAQGVEMRAPLTTGILLRGAIAALRRGVLPLDEDRYLAGDLSRAAELVADGTLIDAVPKGTLPALSDG